MMTSSSTSLIEQISVELLVCRLCNDTLRRPKTLSCRHSFCEGCLFELRGRDLQQLQSTTSGRASSDLYLSCPVCQTRSLVPPGGIRRLPDDPVVTRLSDVIERRRKSPSFEGDSCEDRDGAGGRKLCEICVSAAPSNNIRRRIASSRCLECAKLMCSVCARLHRKTNVTSGHSLLDLDSVTSSFCRFHDNEQVRFYCDQCDACVCVLCTYGDHAGHTMTSFSDAVENQRRSLQAITDRCKVHLKVAQGYLDRVERFHTEISQAENAINEAAIEAVTGIRHRERDLLAALRSIYRRSSTAADDGNSPYDAAADRKPLAACCKRLNETCQMAERMMSDLDGGSSAAGFLIARTGLIDRMTSALDELRTYRNSGRLPSVYFDSGDDDDGNGGGGDGGRCSSSPPNHNCGPQFGSVSFVPYGVQSAMAMLLGRLSVQQPAGHFCNNGLVVGSSGGGDENRNDLPNVVFEETRSGKLSNGGGDGGSGGFDDLVTFTTSPCVKSDVTHAGMAVDVEDGADTTPGSATHHQQQQLSDLSWPVAPSKSSTDTRSVDVQTDEMAENCAAPAGNCDASGSGVVTLRSVANGCVRQPEVVVVHTSTAECVDGSRSKHCTRRVQTDAMTYRDKSTETVGCTTDNKSTSCASGSLVSVDRSTMTTVVYRGPGRDRSTSTDWLVVTRDQETSTLPPVSISCGTQADKPKTRCRAVDAKPETVNKGTYTSPFSVFGGSVDGSPWEDQQKLSHVGIRPTLTSPAKMVDACVGDDVALPEVRRDDHEATSVCGPNVLSAVDKNKPHREDQKADALDAGKIETETELAGHHGRSDEAHSNFAHDDFISPKVDQTENAAESQCGVLTTALLKGTFPDGNALLIGLLNRLTNLMPDIVRTADVLAASHFSSALTSRLLFEVAAIGQQLQMTSSMLSRSHTQDVATITDTDDVTEKHLETADADVISVVDRAVGDYSASIVDASSETCPPELVHRGSGPDSRSSPTTVDCGVGDSVATTKDCSTLMTSRPATFDKETSTKHGHLVHKNVGTDSQSTADKQTSTQTTDVAAVYLGSTMSRRTLTVSRGTCTPPFQPAVAVAPAAASTSTTERGSSPIRVHQVDKAVSANKAEALEPVDLFQAPLSPRSRRGQLVASPRSKLAAINEAADDENKLENEDQLCSASSSAADEEERSSVGVLPPMSSVSSRLVAARSQTRAVGSNVRCGITSLPHQALGRQRPSLPCSLLTAPQLSRNVFNFDNLLEANASRQGALSTSTGPTPKHRLSAGVPVGRLTSMQSKSSSLPDFTRLNVPTIDLMPCLESYQLPAQSHESDDVVEQQQTKQFTTDAEEQQEDLS